MNCLVKLSDRLIINLDQVSSIERGRIGNGGWWLWVIGRANAYELTEAEMTRLERCFAEIGGKLTDLTTEEMCEACGFNKHDGDFLFINAKTGRNLICDGRTVWPDGRAG